MKPIIHVVMLIGLSLGCSVESPVTAPVEIPARRFDAQAARSNIVAALPSGWSAISPSWQQDSITALCFAHAQTESFLLVGPQSNYIDWTDRAGGTHREHIAKECLYIWLVPGDFKSPCPRFGEDFRAEELYSSRTIRAYGHIQHHIADTNRWDTILKDATRISSPGVSISWSNWQRDIGTSLKN
jgi:hypothetical protein